MSYGISIVRIREKIDLIIMAPHSNAHYNDVIMGSVASQITSLTIVYSAVYWGADQRKHQSSASLAFVRVVHQGPVNSPHKWSVTRKMFPFDDVMMHVICTKLYQVHCALPCLATAQHMHPTINDEWWQHLTHWPLGNFNLILGR